MNKSTGISLALVLILISVAGIAFEVHQDTPGTTTHFISHPHRYDYPGKSTTTVASVSTSTLFHGNNHHNLNLGALNHHSHSNPNLYNHLQLPLAGRTLKQTPGN